MSKISLVLFCSVLSWVACAQQGRNQQQSISPEVLQFDHPFVDCEDKWVAYRADSNGAHSFGFIYIDEAAGLTIDMAGSFRIVGNGTFVREKSPFDTMSVKIRLEPNNVLVAVIPTSKFAELRINAQPDWLKYYEEDTGTLKRLVRWGFIYNDYDRPAKAVPYLERAQRLEPHFKGLVLELAFAYNALKQYDKTIAVLTGATDEAAASPCYYYKEFAFAQNHLKKMNEAVATYKQAIRICKDQKMRAEMAFNIAFSYYQAKDKVQFKYWANETRKWATDGDQFNRGLSSLESKIDQ